MNNTCKFPFNKFLLNGIIFNFLFLHLIILTESASIVAAYGDTNHFYLNKMARRVHHFIIGKQMILLNYQ